MAWHDLSVRPFSTAGAVAGITLHNAILMVSSYDLLTGTEGHAWTFATALNLLPPALGSGEPGREIEGPVAIVILGGLLSLAALNPLVLPGLALRFGRFGGQDRPA